MSRHFERPRLVATLLGFSVVQALAIGALLLTPVLDTRAAASRPAQVQSQAKALPAPRIIERAELDAWRDEAALGGAWAGVQLVGALLDRYERSHDSDDLYEAMQWLDRGWPAIPYQDSLLATRVFDRHCDHKVLRWHWMCDRGE